MKKEYYSIIAFFLLTFSALQAQTTEGTDFWLTYGQNATVPLVAVDLQIRIVAKDHKTNVTIFFTQLGTSVDTVIEARQVYTHILTQQEKSAVYNTYTGTTNLSVHITTTMPVTVYALNQAGATADATNILPVTALGTEYYQISYTTTPSAITDAYAVIATENNTQVYQNNVSVAPPLNKGDVYYIVNVPDMTGDYISANKPIAHFALTKNYFIYGSADHLMQQMAPIHVWGKEFFAPVSHPVHDVVRIVVSQNNTNITQVGGTIRAVGNSQTTLTNLQAGQFVELEIPFGSFGCSIQADKPVGVCTFYGGGAPYGDASIAWLAPIAQSVTTALVAPFIPKGNTYIHSHYAVVVTPTLTRGNTMVSIGGAPATNLIGGSWIENTTAGMSFYKMPLTNETAAYYFTNPAGFLIYCYGYGNSESYYYLAYSAMRNLSAAFTANNIPYNELHSHPFCEHDITFVANIEGIHPNPGSLNWYINGVHQTALTDLHTWNQNFATGNYVIKMSVLFEDNSTEIFQDTLKIITCETAFYANNVHSDTLQNITFCEKTVNFQAEIEGQWVSIKWYLNGVEETTASNQETWSKEFTPGEHIGIPVKMEVLYANNETVTIESALNVRVFWTQIKNIRH